MSEQTLTFRINAEDNASATFGQVSQAAQQMSGEVEVAGGSLGSLSTDMNKTGQAANQAAGNAKSFGTALAGIAFGVTSAASGIIGFARTFDQLDNALDRSAKSSHTLERANQAVTKAQEKYNSAVAAFGPNSAQAQAALQNLNNKLNAQSDAANKAQNDAEKVGFAYANLALEAV